jgi:hypothetical protein
MPSNFSSPGELKKQVDAEEARAQEEHATYAAKMAKEQAARQAQADRAFEIEVEKELSDLRESLAERIQGAIKKALKCELGQTMEGFSDKGGRAKDGSYWACVETVLAYGGPYEKQEARLETRHEVTREAWARVVEELKPELEALSYQVSFEKTKNMAQHCEDGGPGDTYDTYWDYVSGYGAKIVVTWEFSKTGAADE